MRRSIVDSLLILATTRKGRDRLREKNAYPVIKAYHVTEDNEETDEQVFKLVDLLLRDEDEHERDGVWDLRLRKEIMGVQEEDEDESSGTKIEQIDDPNATYEDLHFLLNNPTQWENTKTIILVLFLVSFFSKYLYNYNMHVYTYKSIYYVRRT